MPFAGKLQLTGLCQVLTLWSQHEGVACMGAQSFSKCRAAGGSRHVKQPAFLHCATTGTGPQQDFIPAGWEDVCASPSCS